MTITIITIINLPRHLGTEIELDDTSCPSNDHSFKREGDVRHLFCPPFINPIIYIYIYTRTRTTRSVMSDGCACAVVTLTSANVRAHYY